MIAAISSGYLYSYSSYFKYAHFLTPCRIIFLEHLLHKYPPNFLLGLFLVLAIFLILEVLKFKIPGKTLLQLAQVFLPGLSFLVYMLTLLANFFLICFILINPQNLS